MNVRLNEEKRYIFAPNQGKGYVIEGNMVETLCREEVSALGVLQQILLNDNSLIYKKAIERKWIKETTSASLETPYIHWISNLKHLKRLQIEITLRCNLTCPHCYCSAGPKEAKGLRKDELLNLIEQASNMGVIYIDFTGGECLSRKDIFDLLGFANKRKMITSIFTNATFINEVIAKKIKSLNVNFVQVSLYGFKAKTHDDFVGKSGAFKKTVFGIRCLTAFGINVSVNIMAHKNIKKELIKAIKFVKNDLGVKFSIDRIAPTGRAKKLDLALGLQEYYSLMKSINSHDRIFGKVCENIGIYDNSEKISPHCGVGHDYMFIQSDGTAAICPTLTKNESLEFASGNICQSPLEAIWDTDPVFNKYREIQCKNISSCPAAISCKGGCRSNAYLFSKQLDSPDEMNCNIFKNKTMTYMSTQG